MNTSKVNLVVGLILVAAILYFGRNSTKLMDDVTEQYNPVEIASILWKARIESTEINFLSDDRTIHILRFNVGEKHVRSVTYRNLNGYFDPVFVTVWRRDQSFRSLIIDPVREQILLEIVAESDIDISIASDNHILLTYASDNDDVSSNEDVVIVWPPRR